MNIIEKLGITPIEESWFEDVDHVLKDQVRNAEQHSNEMLEALIAIVEFMPMRDSFPKTETRHGAAAERMYKAIEKSTGKSWEEIKEFL